MINAIIIEDELNSRILLNTLLEEYCKEIDVIGFAKDVDSGIKIIKQLKPDLIFLDIEMPGGDGFEILKAFDPIPFKVIFVTGYDHFAIQAIKFSALDYLLKPISIVELQTAVKKAENDQQLDKIRLQGLEWNLQNNDSEDGQLVISSDQKHVLFQLNEVIYIEALGGYVNFVLEGNRKHLSTHSLSYYEEILPVELFFRTHKSYIVNCKKVISVSTGRGGNINLKDGHSIPIAFRRKTSFIQLIGLKS